MKPLADILKERIELSERNPQGLKIFYATQGKELAKKRNFAIKCFTDRINKDRKASGLKDLPFVAISQKLYCLREIEDLKWMWKLCAKYATTFAKEKDIKGRPLRHTFSECFFGSLKIK